MHSLTCCPSPICTIAPQLQELLKQLGSSPQGAEHVELIKAFLVYKVCFYGCWGLAAPCCFSSSPPAAPGAPLLHSMCSYLSSSPPGAEYIWLIEVFLLCRVSVFMGVVNTCSSMTAAIEACCYLSRLYIWIYIYIFVYTLIGIQLTKTVLESWKESKNVWYFSVGTEGQWDSVESNAELSQTDTTQTGIPWQRLWPTFQSQWFCNSTFNLSSERAGSEGGHPPPS